MLKEAKEVCFIQPAIEREEALGHKGYTHKLLGIQKDYNLSHAETLLEGIVETDIGKTFKNPLKIGKKTYKVTPELKKHVNFALNLIRISQKKGPRV